MKKNFLGQEQRWKVLEITRKEKLISGIKTVVCVSLVVYCFYQDLRFYLLLLLPAIYFYRLEIKDRYRRKKEEFRSQFKELLTFATTAQKAGYAIESAFVSGYADMSNLYGERSGICLMLKEIKDGLRNGVRMQDLLKKLGCETQIEEIVEFSNVFQIAKESGGNMVKVMEYTAENIEERVETKKEIETFLSARKLEWKVMNLMPMLLIIYLNMTSPGYFSSLYHSLTGRVIMTGCLVIYFLAYLLGNKIMDIGV